MPPETTDTKSSSANTTQSNDPAQLLGGKDGKVNFSTTLLNGSLTGEAGQSTPGNYFGKFEGKNNANGNTVFGDLKLSTDPTFKLNEYHLGTQFGVGSNGKATVEVTGTPPEDKVRFDAKVVDPNGGQVAAGATIQRGNLTQADILLQRDDNKLTVKNEPGKDNLTTADLTAMDAKKNTYTANGTFDNKGTQNLGLGATISDPNGKTVYDASVQPVNNTGTVGFNRTGSNDDVYNGRVKFSAEATTYNLNTNTNLPINGGNRHIETDTTLTQPSNGALTGQTRVTATDTRGDNKTVTTFGADSQKADIGITTHSVYPNKAGTSATLDTNFALDTNGKGSAGVDHRGANGSQHKADVGLTNGVVNFSSSTSDPARVFNTPGVVKTNLTAGGEAAATGSVSFDSTPQTLKPTQSGVTAFGASAGFDAPGVNVTGYVKGQVAIDANTRGTYQGDVKVTPQSTVASGQVGFEAERGSTKYTGNVKANTEVGFQEANLGITTGNNFTATAFAKPGDVGGKFEYKSGDTTPAKPYDAQVTAKQINGATNDFQDKQAIALLSPQDKKLFDQAVAGVEKLNATQGAGLNVEKTALFAVANVPSDNGKRAENIELAIGNPAKGGQTLIVGNGNLRDPATEKTAFNPQTASNTPIAESASSIKQQNTIAAVQQQSAPAPSLDNLKRAAP